MHDEPSRARSRTNGLASSVAGYTLVTDRTVLPVGRSAALRFRILDARAAARPSFDVDGGVRLHLIVVRRDLTGYQHVHPQRAARRHRGRVPVTLAAPGAYRAYADFEVDGTKTVLGHDLFVAGHVHPALRFPPSLHARADGYDVELDARRAAREQGERSSLPRSAATGSPSPRSTSTSAAAATSSHCTRATSPTRTCTPSPARRPARSSSTPSSPPPGSYRLFLQFKADGVVHTARSPSRSHDERRRDRAPRPADRGDDVRVVRVRASSGKLNKLDGVSASVNYATEKAVVEYDPAQVDAARRWSTRSRRRATPPACRRPSRRQSRKPDRRRSAPPARRRARCSRCRCSLMGMIPALQFTLLAVARAPARDARRALGGLAVPRRRLEEPAPRDRDDGHADLARHARRRGAGRSSRSSSSTRARRACGCRSS